MQPRTEDTWLGNISWKVVVGSAAAFLVAIVSEFLAESGMSLIEWEAGWAESSTSFAIDIVAAAILSVAIVLFMRTKAEKNSLNEGV